MNNFKRCLESNYRDIVNILYRRIISLFILALKNDHLSNSKNILQQLFHLLIKNKKLQGLEILILGNIMLRTKVCNNLLQKRLKSITIYKHI